MIIIITGTLNPATRKFMIYQYYSLSSLTFLPDAQLLPYEYMKFDTIEMIMLQIM